MKEIKFNKGFRFTKAGEAMEIVSLAAMPHNVEKDKQWWFQMFATGKRENKESLNWEAWNGCVFVDIDSKHFYNECKPFKVDNLFVMLHDYLCMNYSANFYAMQLSNSGTSFHFVFYFDVEHSEVNYIKCQQYAVNAVHDGFIAANAQQIWDFKGVVDKCTTSPLQGMFVSSYEWQFGACQENNFGVFDIDEYELQESPIDRVSDIKEDGTKLFTFDGYKQTDFKMHCDNLTRWRIYTTLIGVFGDKTKVDSEWANNIVPHLIKTHATSNYYDAPTKGQWWEQYDAKYVDINLLQKFGYSFKKTFAPKPIELYKPDVVYELDEGQKLSDLNIDWSHDKINHLYAGCSLGKTYNAKQLGKQIDIDDIDWIFGERNKRVCFISPMTSINADSFENIDGWVIIDNHHNELNSYLHNDVLHSSMNICTTWESFVLHKMYDLNFDFVIVDEIHTLYMYDYRLRSIYDLKRYLKAAHGIKIIMTGTPSAEVHEFDCYKIEVKKKLQPVSCDLVFYTKSFRGYYMNDIAEWTKEANHYALIFDDKANYQKEELFNCYGLKCDIFNKSYKDNCEWILTNHDVKSQITIFSVYGQAGINLTCANNQDKKFRIYILNSNALGVIQYANRMRCRNLIDKIVIGFKYENMSNTTCQLNTAVDFSDVTKKVEQLNLAQHKTGVFSLSRKQAIKLKFGLNTDYLDVTDGTYTINENLFRTYAMIKNVEQYEGQLQIIWNRLIANYFDVHCIYLSEDVKDIKTTRMRSDTFGGQLANFDYGQIHTKKDGQLWVKPNDTFEKICTGDTKQQITNILNIMYQENGSDFEATCDKFGEWVLSTIQTKKSITKSDVKNYSTFLHLKHDWENYYDNAFLVIMQNERWSTEHIVAAYIRCIWKEGMNLKMVEDDAYKTIKKLRKIVNEYANGDMMGETHKIPFENDDKMKEICAYVMSKHTHAKQHNEHKSKNIIVNGEVFKSKKEAYSKYGRRFVDVWINTHQP